MKTKAVTLLAILFSCLTTVLANEDSVLELWQAGQTVSSKAVERYGIARCFVAVEIPDNVWHRMQGRTYKDNPYIGRKDLRYLKLLHWDYDQQTHLGEMVCNAAIAHELVDIFRQLYQARYPIQRMVLPDNYGADDEQQMRANNTSCFCYRVISGSQHLSKHAKGLAVDLNTLYNPYVIPRKGKRPEVQPSTATEYTNRSKSFHYKIDHNDLAYKLFKAYGYKWGGDWQSRKDYQHFEKDETKMTKRVITGDERTELYLPVISGKRVALFSNQTGLAGTEQEHVLDQLIRKGAKVTAVFSPEHGSQGKSEGFFTSFFDKLLGHTYVREMIVEGCSEAEIRARWKNEVEDFKQKRKKYLLYE